MNGESLHIFHSRLEKLEEDFLRFSKEEKMIAAKPRKIFQGFPFQRYGAVDNPYGLAVERPLNRF